MFAVVVRWEEFDEPLDALIYSVAVARGVATVENVLYVHRIGLGLLRAAAAAASLLIPLGFHTACDLSLLGLRGAVMCGAFALLSVALWAYVLKQVAAQKQDEPLLQA